MEMVSKPQHEEFANKSTSDDFRCDGPGDRAQGDSSASCLGLVNDVYSLNYVYIIQCLLPRSWDPVLVPDVLVVQAALHKAQCGIKTVYPIGFAFCLSIY